MREGGNSGWKPQPFYNLILEMTFHHFYCMLLVIQINYPCTVSEGITQRYEEQVVVVKKKKCLPLQEKKEIQFLSLGRKDPLEEGIATHSSIFPWRIPWTEEPGGLQSIGLQRGRPTEAT